jgi:hypothetical protein
MTKRLGGVNPFYVLLLIVGMAFFVTTCAYMMMTFADVNSARGGPEVTDSPMINFMEEHGNLLMGVELGLLAICTVGAITTDRWWSPPPKGSQPISSDASDDDAARPE